MSGLTFLRSALPGVALAACVMFASPAFAETISFKADLKAGDEVPPNDSKATGTVTATYDTASKKLTGVFPALDARDQWAGVRRLD